MPSDKNFLRKRACVRPRVKDHCAALAMTPAPRRRSRSARPRARRWGTATTAASRPHARRAPVHARRCGGARHGRCAGGGRPPPQTAPVHGAVGPTTAPPRGQARAAATARHRGAARGGWCQAPRPTPRVPCHARAAQGEGGGMPRPRRGCPGGGRRTRGALQDAGAAGGGRGH